MISGIRQLLAACAVTITAAACGQPAGDPVDDLLTNGVVPAVGVVLPASEMQRLLTSCDGSQAKADSLWSPSDLELRAVELALNHRLEAEFPMNAGDPIRDYSRQYLGLYRSGEKLVYIRGVHQVYLARALTFDTQSVPQSVKVAGVIRRFGERAVSVCDGGRGFFRAEYSLRTQRISQFSFQDYESR